ncbi:DNA mismatch repair protein [Mucilaginibacter sp. SG564]|uniref:MutS-related protein n=1 Tax=Mucilaginibacter sp. SG564 TaxID=2587022 RepID=UPI0015556327|nr:DNA mismatch repair protein [Mucilaginibacter sp. SG564]NOW96009.1 DNA mismatch repair ATPase MutS [Mucilaginibacter sp. SG564]
MFTVDAQTIADLELLSRDTNKSILRLFSQTRTRGGARLIENMFQAPLNEAGQINTRSNIIAYFSAHQVELHIDADLMDNAEQYLNERDERTRFVADPQSLKERVTSLVVADTTVKTISRGITAVITLLHSLRDFLSEKNVIGCLAFANERAEMLRQLALPAFGAIFGHPAKSKLSNEQMAESDRLLRFTYFKEVSELISFIYLLDVYVSVGKVASEKGFSYATAITSATCQISVSGFYHPLLKNAVDNDLKITPDRNVVFLTGANMAGKSTLMKSLSITLYLAHMGFPVPAREVVFSVLDGIFTTINLPDNLGMGMSHFYAEVLRLKKVAKELSASKKLLVIFDELFRGTNVKDAYEGTIAVTRAFAKIPASAFIISTHITEAGDVLRKESPTVAFDYLPTRMNNNTPVYTYKLETGITDDRHGMIIIGNEKIIELLNEGRKRSI